MKAKLVDGVLKYATNYEGNISNPTDEQLTALGFKDVTFKVPQTVTSMYYLKTVYTENKTTIFVDYEVIKHEYTNDEIADLRATRYANEVDQYTAAFVRHTALNNAERAAYYLNKMEVASEKINNELPYNTID